MREFCPLCSKNGVKTKIKAYQLNLQEAVFLCTSENCTWPVGCEELKFIDRPVGKDWSETWDDLAFKTLETEPEPELLLDFTAYTPPQTPGTEIIFKDVTSNNTFCPATVPDEAFNSLPAISNNSVNKSEESSTDTRSKQCDSSVNISINSNNMKPKLIVSEPFNNFKIKTFNKKAVVLKPNESINEISKSVKLLTNNTNISTSLDKNSIKINNNQSNCKVRNSRGILKNGLKLSNRKKTKVTPYEKFDFEALLKNKSTNIKKEHFLEMETEELKEKSKECFNSSNTEENACVLNKSLNLNSTNVIDEHNIINIVHIDRTIVDSSNNSQSEFDSITSSSKDSGLEQDILENSDLDLNLDDLLAGFTESGDDITNTINSNIDNFDECKWIDSLFGSC